MDIEILGGKRYNRLPSFYKLCHVIVSCHVDIKDTDYGRHFDKPYPPRHKHAPAPSAAASEVPEYVFYHPLSVHQFPLASTSRASITWSAEQPKSTVDV
ncbi:hypothetical protein SUGI_0125660 [Cryptomeria japonica]|nr:hypothetical protein SUGI_0125660 [Cryptomeria japonica]